MTANLRLQLNVKKVNPKKQFELSKSSEKFDTLTGLISYSSKRKRLTCWLVYLRQVVQNTQRIC